MDESDFKRLNLYLDGHLRREDVRALERRLAAEAPLRVALESLQAADRWLGDPETWSASVGELSDQLSQPPVGEENAELGALRAAVDAFEQGEAPAASESLLQRIQARGTPSRSRSGRARKASVRLARRSARLRIGSGSQRLRRRSSRAGAVSGSVPRAQSARRAVTARIARPGRTPSHAASPWSAWVGLVAAACLAVIVGGLVFSRPASRPDTAQAPAPQPRIETPQRPAPERPQQPVPEELPTPIGQDEGPLVAPERPELTQPEPTAEPEFTQPEPATDVEPAEPTQTVARVDEPIRDDGGRLRTSARLRGELERFVDGRWEPLAADMELAPGQRVRANAPSFASLDGGAYELCLDRDTELLVRAAQDGPVLELERGRVLAEVASLQQHERFEVRAGQGAYRVLGTVFEVARDGAASSLGVLEGAVRASRGAESLVAPAGHGARIADALTAQDAPDAGAWAAGLRPQRVTAWAVDFERGAEGFSGRTVPGHEGQGLELPASGERAWSRGTAATHELVVTPDLYLQLSVRATEDATVVVRFTNATQDDRPFMATYAVRAGEWRTLTIPFEALSTLYDPALNPLRDGDRLTQLEVFAGDPRGSASVVIDGLRVYRKRY
ncbi:MAG: FecR domain-containing protein [Planctomycetota bacterium]